MTYKFIEFRIDGKPVKFSKYFDSIYINKEVVGFFPLHNKILLFLQKINRYIFIKHKKVKQ